MRIEVAGCSVQIKPFMQEQMKKIAWQRPEIL